MDALGALGAIYSGSESDEDDEEQPAAIAPAKAAATVQSSSKAAAPVAVPAALPDAGDLLGDLPDEVDWSFRETASSTAEAPAHDPVGTKYNAVALPGTLASDARTHNEAAAGRSHPSGARPLRQAPPPARSDGSGKNLLPPQVRRACTRHGPTGTAHGRGPPPRPATAAAHDARARARQLRRPNKSTEDSAAWRTAKRHKAGKE